MTSSHRVGQHRNAPTRADLDETILVWNGVVKRTERSPKAARQADFGVEDKGDGAFGAKPVGGDRRKGMTAVR